MCMNTLLIRSTCIYFTITCKCKLRSIKLELTNRYSTVDGRPVFHLCVHFNSLIIRMKSVLCFQQLVLQM